MCCSRSAVLFGLILPVVLVMAFAPVEPARRPGHLAADPTALGAAVMSGALTDSVLQTVFDRTERR